MQSPWSRKKSAKLSVARSSRPGGEVVPDEARKSRQRSDPPEQAHIIRPIKDFDLCSKSNEKCFKAGIDNTFRFVFWNNWLQCREKIKISLNWFGQTIEPESMYVVQWEMMVLVTDYHIFNLSNVHSKMDPLGRHYSTAWNRRHYLVHHWNESHGRCKIDRFTCQNFSFPLSLQT